MAENAACGVLRMFPPIRTPQFRPFTCWNHLYFGSLDTCERRVLAFSQVAQFAMSPSLTRHAEAGSGRIKAIIWTGILAAFVYVCVQVVPLYMADYQFHDTMQTAARYASVNRQSADDIRLKLFKEAAKAEMPLRLEDIKVDSTEGRVRIKADYSVTVDLHVYQLTLNFHPSASNDQL